MLRVGVILSGCGFLDGAEITEAVCTLLSLDQRGAEAVCLAPRLMLDEVDHLTGQPTGKQRCVLAESGRIARGTIHDLAELNGSEFDALVLPGGYGAAKNLCTFASQGAAAAVREDVSRLLRQAHQARKPIGFICIAPAVAALLFGGEGIRLTIGHDADTAAALESLGATHVECTTKNIVVDEARRIVSTPAYMTAKGPAEVYLGVDQLIAQLLQWAAMPLVD